MPKSPIKKTNAVPLALAYDTSATLTVDPIAVLFLWNNGQIDYGFETDADAELFKQRLLENRIEHRSYNPPVEQSSIA